MTPHPYVWKTLRVLSVLLLSSVACAAQQVDLSGKVFSSEHVPIPAASVALHCAADARNDAHTSTRQDGSYDLPSLAVCKYTLSVAAGGYSTLASTPIDVTAAHPVSYDVVLSRASAAAPADRPSFQAAGIHGLIDPGGYSASATAGVASNVLHDVAGVQRDNAATYTSSRSEDCTALEQRIQIAQQHPQDWQANGDAGRSLLQNGAAGAAIPYLLRSDAIAPAYAADVRLNLAEALVLFGNFDEALTRLASLSPSQAGPRYYPLRAQAEEGLGEFDTAIRDRSEALEQTPTPDNVFALAYGYLLAGHVDEANRVLDDGFVRLHPSVSLLVARGAVQFFQHNVASALQTLLQAAHLDPRDRRPYPLLADISRLPNVDTAGVQQAMERHLAIDPDDAKGNAALGTFLVAHTATDSPNAWHAQGSAASPDTQRARQLLQHALTLDSRLIQARSDLAQIYHRERNFRLEAAELARVASEEPSREVQYRLGLAYRDSGQPELSKVALQLARDVPNSPQVSAAHIASLLSVAPSTQAALPCSSASSPSAIHVFSTSSAPSSPR